MAAIVRSRYG